MARRHVHPEDARDAAARIRDRRLAVEDRRRSVPMDLEGVAGYVHQHARVPTDTMWADVGDAWEVLDGLADLVDAHRLAVVRAGQQAGMTWRDLASVLGQRTKQGVAEVIGKLERDVGRHPRQPRRSPPARLVDRRYRSRLTGRAGDMVALGEELIGLRAVLPVAVLAELAEVEVLLPLVTAAGDAAAVRTLALLSGRLFVVLDDLAEHGVTGPLAEVVQRGKRVVRG